ncbi:MAG TPA: S6e family ribosomal protein [Candidatus Lokiarchaeia archaeon]|nr:S6e family ribosomal protein [Candidatus Lokiarchaeia archaeon]
MSEQITYRLNISKAEKSMQITVEPNVFFKALVGKKIDETVDGGLIGYPGYEFQVKGGSDYAGFPMRKDVQGGIKKRILAGKASVGIRRHRIRAGDRIRVLVRGNTITDQIVQVNMIVVKEGKVQLFVEKKAEGEEGGEESEAPAKKAAAGDKKKKK